jgi:CBS domain-containing protein/anti-sigma regulatory factor (Ser/Thr protein kinase)
VGGTRADMMDPMFAKTRELLFQLRVVDIQRAEVVTMRPDQMMSDLRTTLRDHRISGTPVVENGQLVGIISIEDLVRWLSEGGRDCPIGEKMTRNPVSLYSDQFVAHAVQRFEQSGFGRLPVLDRQNGRLVGIVTRAAIIEGMLGRLEHALREEEIRQYRASHIFEDIVAEYKEIYLTYDVMGKDFDRAGKASTRMKRNLKRLGIRPDIAHRLAVASYEAEMNVVIYADRGTMEYRITPDEIYLRIRDHGPGIADVEKAMQPGYSTAPDWVRELGFGAGMGLQNIKKCADRMELESTVGTGTTLTIWIHTGRDDETE